MVRLEFPWHLMSTIELRKSYIMYPLSSLISEKNGSCLAETPLKGLIVVITKNDGCLWLRRMGACGKEGWVLVAKKDGSLCQRGHAATSTHPSFSGCTHVTWHVSYATMCPTCSDLWQVPHVQCVRTVSQDSLFIPTAVLTADIWCLGYLARRGYFACNSPSFFLVWQRLRPLGVFYHDAAKTYLM